MWDTATGKLDKTLKYHSSPVEAVAYSPDRQHIVSRSLDSTVKMWDVATGKLDKTREDYRGNVKYIAASLPARSSNLESTATTATTATRQSPPRSRQRSTSQDAIRRDYPASPGSPPMQAQAQSTQQDHSIGGLVVHDFWIYYEETAILRLALELRANCYDTRNGRVVIGCDNSRVVRLHIDLVTLLTG